MSDLLSLQRRFRQALTGAPGALDDFVTDAARRIEIHRTTIEAGLAQTLANVFPTARRIVGAPTFAALAATYIAAAPPRHPVLSNYGREFPPFISTHPVGISLPYLQDIASLEWWRHEAYLAADAAALDAGCLDTADPESVSALQLRLHPAARVISSPYPIHTIWKLNQPDVDDDDIPAVDMNQAEHVVVTRPGNEVLTRAIGVADATFVRAVAGGASLESAVEAALAVSPAFNVTQVLAGHFAGGTFASL